MRRRAILATIPAAIAGCTVGYSSVGQEPEDTAGDLSSEGNDDVPIRASVEELLLTVDDLEENDWWRREIDDEHCREFRYHGSDATDILTVCAWVLEDVKEAEEHFETRVDRTWKLSRGDPTDVDQPVGVETKAIRDTAIYHVIFRDANAVGSVRYERDFTGAFDPDNFPEVDDALRYASLMHQRWRE